MSRSRSCPDSCRESPLNAIWEGSGNVIALDLLRALQTRPDTAEAFLEEVEVTRGADSALDGAIDDLATAIRDGAGAEGGARRLAGSMAAVLAASLLVRHADPVVAEAFIATRVAGGGGHLYGTLPAGVDTAAISAKAVPG